MTLTHDRLTKLLAVRAQEDAKGRGKHQRAPAMFRETALDTHKTTPAEYFGPPPVERPDHPTRLSTGTRNMSRNQLAATVALTRKSTMQEGEFRSVFRPTPEQEAACGAAKERRNNVASSEWALLDTLGVQMYLDERDQKQRAVRAVQAGQRSYLDGQMREVEAAKASQEHQKTVDKQVMEATVARYKEEDRAVRERTLAANLKVKAEQDAMLSAARRQKATAAEAKRGQEAALLAAAQAAIDADKGRAAAKMAAEKESMERTLADNAARLAARKAEELAQRQQDDLLMKQTIETLERQERAREQATKDFHAMIAARAGRAGQKAVEENRARLEREERLMREAEELNSRREAERAVREAAKKQQQKQELLDARQEYLRSKAAKEAAARAEVVAAKAAIEARAAAEKEAEDRKMAAIRERVTATKSFVVGQMATRAEHSKVDDVFMSEEERKLNARLLEQARAVVQEPKQYSVRLY